jgi:hypothetical protein
MLGEVWRDTKHHVKLGNSVSKSVYPATRRNQYGAGQGSCLAPLLWVMMSTAIYNLLDKVPYRTTLDLADGVNTHERNSDGFVDDTALSMTVPRQLQENATINYSIKGITELGQTAERSLHVSGGALELSKCFWY